MSGFADLLLLIAIIAAIFFYIQYRVIKAAVMSALHERSKIESRKKSEPSHEKRAAEPEPTACETVLPKLADDEAYLNSDGENHTGICSVCGFEQYIGRDKCEQCGRKFVN